MRKELHSTIVVLAASFLSSCAHKPNLTLEQIDSQVAENRKASTRVYKKKSIEEVRVASQKVLFLLDPPDMKFDTQENQLLATRTSTFYAVFSVGYGRDWYSVTMKQTPIGVESKFGLTDQMNVGPFPPYIQLSFKPDIPVSAYDNPKDFKLFHDRVEYMLGIRDAWPTCDEAKKFNGQDEKDMRLCDSLGLENLAPQIDGK